MSTRGVHERFSSIKRKIADVRRDLHSLREDTHRIADDSMMNAGDGDVEFGMRYVDAYTMGHSTGSSEAGSMEQDPWIQPEDRNEREFSKAWRKGFGDARSEAPSAGSPQSSLMESANGKSSAFDEGVADFGRMVYENRYKLGTAENREWNRGWMHSYNECKGMKSETPAPAPSPVLESLDMIKYGIKA